jgi:hypothetical protein
MTKCGEHPAQTLAYIREIDGVERVVVELAA